jgi:predicted ATPase
MDWIHVCQLTDVDRHEKGYRTATSASAGAADMEVAPRQVARLVLATDNRRTNGLRGGRDMPIDYKLKTLTINAFRGIPALEIDLPCDAPLVLIGGNNCGKSTILDSIAFALEGAKFYNYDIQEFDFYRDASGAASDTFSIEIDFSADRVESLPAVRGIENPISIYGSRAKGRRIKKSGKLEARVELFQKDRKAATYAPRTPLKGDAKERWAEHDIGFTKYTARWKDIQELRPEVWQLTPDNLNASLYKWKTGPLHRLSSWLAKSFLETPWTFQQGDSKRAMPESIRNAHKFFSEAVANFPLWKDDLRPRFAETLSSYIGRDASLELRPQIQDIEDWLTQQLMLSFSTDGGGAATPLHCMGHGWQSLVRMAALEVLSQIPDQVRQRVVLLVEEPETYLHPHLARRFRRVLGALAAQGWSVVMTTHSPYLFRFDAEEVVLRLRREGSEVSAGSAKGSDVSELFRVQAKLDERGTHEFVFAQHVVLCEGKDDVYALKLYLNKLKADLDTLCVTIVDAGGVQSIPDYAKLAGNLVIPWIAVTDQDPIGNAVNPKTEKARKKLAQLTSIRDQQTQWKNNLEHCLSSGDVSPQWLAENIEPLGLTDIRTHFPNFAVTADTVARFLGINL